MSFRAIFVVTSLILSGCTTIEISGEASTKMTRFGVMKIDAADDAKIITYKLSGVGIVPSQSGVTVGYRNETVALVRDPNDCRIIIFEFPEDKQSQEFWRDYLRLNKDVCVIKQEKKDD